jgi:hypothetical protein
VKASDGGTSGGTGVDIPRTWTRAGQGRTTDLPTEVRRLGAHLVLACSAEVTPSPARRSHKRAGRVSRVDCRRAGRNLGLPETRKG